MSAAKQEKVNKTAHKPRRPHNHTPTTHERTSVKSFHMGKHLCDWKGGEARRVRKEEQRRRSGADEASNSSPAPSLGCGPARR